MKKTILYTPKRLTMGYLRLSLFATLTASLWLLLSYLEARSIDRVAAAFDHAHLLEYILASILISLGGGLVLELVQRDPRFSKK